MPIVAYCQPEQQPSPIGCPTFVLPFWLSISGGNPNGEWPEFGFETKYKDCYNCIVKNPGEVNVCEYYNQIGSPCPICFNIIMLTEVFNPRSGNYETIYKVIETTNGTTHIWYTYEIKKVPIYATDADGKKWVIGYKWYWNIIPRLTAIETTLNGGRRMIFE
ncbi:MAG: hypothetical protein MUE96_11885 [Bacteroidia bacterium]|jgi:hypothetical protein|nr:hypothetical protein [Bacteroidia bacterium]